MLWVEFKLLIAEVAKKSEWQNLRFALAAGSRQGSGGQCSLQLEIIDDMTLSSPGTFPRHRKHGCFETNSCLWRRRISGIADM